MTDFGPKPTLAWLPIDKVSVDAKYQRDTGSRRSRNLIDKIAAGFRWSRFGVVLAVKHAGGWYVIDGQHRVEACRLRGIQEVPSVVLPHATVEEAAADFVAINRDRVAVTPLHIHHAQLAAGDPEAKTLERACRAAGVQICRYPVPANKMKPGQTLAVSTIARLVKLRGEAFAVAVLKQARIVETCGVSAKVIRLTADSFGSGAPAAAAATPRVAPAPIAPTRPAPRKRAPLPSVPQATRPAGPSERELIERHIAERGITKCPAAIVAPTTGDIGSQDRAAHEARGLDPVGDAWRRASALQPKSRVQPYNGRGKRGRKS